MLKRLMTASVLVVLVHVMASGANASTFDKRTYFTFNQPVALPGVTLPAGTYMFRIANTETSRNVIQVSNKQGTESYALLNTVLAQRPDVPKDSEIRFRETPAGVPPAHSRYVRAAGSSQRFSLSRRPSGSALRHRRMDSGSANGNQV